MITSNLDLGAAPRNVRFKRADSGLARLSDVDVSRILTIDRGVPTARVRALPDAAMAAVDRGLRLVLSLA